MNFKAWVPITAVPNCWLWVYGVNKPKLWFYSPIDYWHSVEPLPDSFWNASFEMMLLANADDIAQQLPAQRGRVGYIGYAPQRARDLGIVSENVNP